MLFSSKKQHVKKTVLRKWFKCSISNFGQCFLEEEIKLPRRSRDKREYHRSIMLLVDVHDHPLVRSPPSQPGIDDHAPYGGPPGVSWRCRPDCHQWLGGGLEAGTRGLSWTGLMWLTWNVGCILRDLGYNFKAKMSLGNPCRRMTWDKTIAAVFLAEGSLGRPTKWVIFENLLMIVSIVVLPSELGNPVTKSRDVRGWAAVGADQHK